MCAWAACAVGGAACLREGTFSECHVAPLPTVAGSCSGCQLEAGLTQGSSSGGIQNASAKMMGMLSPISVAALELMRGCLPCAPRSRSFELQNKPSNTVWS